VAIAGWSDNGKPEMEIVLESTDDGSAREHLTSVVDGHAQVVMHDGYAVLGNTQQAVDDAIAAADKSSLHDSSDYEGDVGALPGNQAITAWFDGPQAKQLLAGTFMGGEEGALAFSGLGAFGAGFNNLFKGRVAVGVHITDTVAELNARSVGQTTTASAPATMLTTLPSGTIGALEIGDPGAVVDAVTPLVKLFGSFSESSTSSCGFGAGSSGGSFAPYPMDHPTRRQLLRQLQKSIPPGTAHRHRVIKQLLDSYHWSGPTCTPEPTPPPDPFAQIQKLIGISFPDGVKTILGERAVVAFGGLELAGLPDVAIRTHPSDLSSAQALAGTLSSTVSSSSPLHIDVSTAGDDLVLATSPTYGQEIAKAGDLGGQQLTKDALGNIPDSVNVAAYVNLSRVWPLITSGVPSGVQHLHAVGFWASTSGDVQTGQLRVVFG